MNKVYGNITLASFHVFISKEDIHMICIVLSMYISSANIAQKLKICVVKFPQSAFQ